VNPQVLQDLRAALAELRRYEAALDRQAATPGLLAELDQGLTVARRLVAAAANRPVTGCRTHPTGPVDHEAGGCLLCNSRRRTATAAPAAEVPVEDVLAAIEEGGQGMAAVRYGARAVARALATAGRRTTSNLPPEFRNRQETAGE
jgi:hypothetical protein